MNNYTREQALTLARGARCSTRGRVMPGREGRTRMRINSVGNPALRYTNTDVVTYLSSGYIRLNTDGWYTKTSKTRIEEYSGVSVWSAMGNWYITDAAGRIHKYEDGMLIKPTAKGVRVKGSKGMSRIQFEESVREYKREKRRVARVQAVKRAVRDVTTGLDDFGHLPLGGGGITFNDYSRALKELIWWKGGK